MHQDKFYKFDNHQSRLSFSNYCVYQKASRKTAYGYTVPAILLTKFCIFMCYFILLGKYIYNIHVYEIAKNKLTYLLI